VAKKNTKTKPSTENDDVMKDWAESDKRDHELAIKKMSHNHDMENFKISANRWIMGVVLVVLSVGAAITSWIHFSRNNRATELESLYREARSELGIVKIEMSKIRERADMDKAAAQKSIGVLQADNNKLKSIIGEKVLEMYLRQKPPGLTPGKD